MLLYISIISICLNCVVISQSVQVVQIKTHPNFVPTNIENGWDIAMLKLKEPAPQQPISLPSSESLPSQSVRVLGFGESSPRLEMTTMGIMSDEMCEKSYPGHGPHIICARDSRSDTCNGRQDCGI